MLKQIDAWDIPDRVYSGGAKKSPGRIKLDEDIMDFVESEDEATEIVWSDYDTYGGDSVQSQRSVLSGAIKSLGLKGFKVMMRGNRLFVIKEDNFE